MTKKIRMGYGFNLPEEHTVYVTVEYPEGLALSALRALRTAGSDDSVSELMAEYYDDPSIAKALKEMGIDPDELEESDEA